MADKKISALTAASTPLAGTEVLPIVQSSATVKVAVDDLTVKNVRSNATTGILQIVGPGTGTTRVMTTPNANFTAARTDAAQSFTGDQTLTTGNLIFGGTGKGPAYPVTTGGSALAPAFSAYLSGNQSITAFAATKVALDTESFDTGSYFDTTNNRFLPKISGYYLITMRARYNGNDAGWRLYKNGGLFMAFCDQSTGGNTTSSSALVYLNGSTDYVELYITASTSSTVQSGESSTTMAGFLLLAA